MVPAKLKNAHTADTVLEKLKSVASPKTVEGMARFGVPTENALGISASVLRRLAREIGPNHALAQALWQSGIHEARILASLVDVPELVTEEQMDRWAGDFDSWDVCDACCWILFDKTPFAYWKAAEWSRRKEEFVKRAGFALIAALAIHDKKASNTRFLKFLPIIQRESIDERNFVKKAVNWALRQIGKRSLPLNRAAVKVAEGIRKRDSRSARWIAADALRELTSDEVERRLRK